MYQNAKIYLIKSKKSDKGYIGSTTKPLPFRLNQHCSLFKLYTEKGIGHHYSSFDILSQGDYYIELYEEYPCQSKKELLDRESEIIRLLGDTVVNVRVDNRTKAERDSRYWNKNKDALKEKQKKPYVCECGSTVRVSDKARHLKSKKHTNHQK